MSSPGIRHRLARRIGLASSLAPLAIACGDVSPAPDGAIGHSAQAVAAERSGLVEFAYRHYNDPSIARTAYASPNWKGCSATMIGPNTLLTAAHCGPTEADANQFGTATFAVYRSDQTNMATEQFFCRRVIHGWPRHDLAVLFCEPNGGVNPGDKYGYLDVETRAPAIGDAVYSIWQNPVDGAGIPNEVPLYSAGHVVSTTEKIWSGILGGPANTPVGIKMDTWGFAGASGSSNIDANTHRILVGPTSTADKDEGPARYAFSMQTYENAELLAPGLYINAGPLQNVTAGNFPNGNYDFASYVGKVDKNNNAVFDVQEDIERQRGENQRSTYWLGFENRRRNALWEIKAVTIDYGSAQTPVSYGGPGLVLRHRFLNLKPNTNYRVGIRVTTTSSGTPAPRDPRHIALTVGFEREDQAAWSTATLTTTPGTDSFQTALLHTDASPAPFFAIRTTSAFSGALRDIELIEDGTLDGFELIDQREGWGTSFGQPASFLPRGVTSTNGAPDFALQVVSLFGGSIPVSTQKLLFLPGRSQDLCFKAAMTAGTGTGTVKITSGSSVVLNATFPLTTAWTRPCFPRIVTPSTDTTLTFASTGTIASSYLVDDVSLVVDPLSPPPPTGIGGLSQTF